MQQLSVSPSTVSSARFEFLRTEFDGEENGRWAGSQVAVVATTTGPEAKSQCTSSMSAWLVWGAIALAAVAGSGLTVLVLIGMMRWQPSCGTRGHKADAPAPH